MKKSTKQGFTLVEMLLAIAITLIISSLFITLIATIRSSYYRSYNDNDCAEIAAMYAEALENTIMYDVQNGISDTISINPTSYVLTNSTNTISFDSIDNFNKSGSGSSAQVKWKISMICNWDEATGLFRYKFFFIDNYIQPGYLHYVYEGCFWLPNYPNYSPQTIGSNDTYDPSSGGTYSWDYNYAGADTSYTISVDPAATVSGNTIVAASGAATTECFTRLTTDSYGKLSATGEDTDKVSVPTTSSVITIGERPVTTPTPPDTTPTPAPPEGDTPEGDTPEGDTPEGDTPGGVVTPPAATTYRTEMYVGTGSGNAHLYIKPSADYPNGSYTITVTFDHPVTVGGNVRVVSGNGTNSITFAPPSWGVDLTKNAETDFYITTSYDSSLTSLSVTSITINAN